MALVSRCINNLCQVGLTGAQTLSIESVNNPGSFAPPATWEELKLALLDILVPANSVEECAIKLATLKAEKSETVSASALRFRATVSRFESAVKRHGKGRTPWAAITVTLWQHSPPLALHLLLSGEKPATLFKEADKSIAVRRQEGFLVKTIGGP